MVGVQSESLFKQIVKTFVDHWRVLRMLKLQDITERPDLWCYADFKTTGHGSAGDAHQNGFAVNFPATMHVAVVWPNKAGRRVPK